MFDHNFSETDLQTHDGHVAVALEPTAAKSLASPACGTENGASFDQTSDESLPAYAFALAFSHC